MILGGTVKIPFTAEKGVIAPSYKTQGASGADVCAFTAMPIFIESGKSAIIPTGLYFQIPSGYEIQVRPRSGLAAKNGITVLNTPGTIDSDYRGELKIILINLGKESFTVNNGDRIAQIVVSPVFHAQFLKTDILDKTIRGEGGFGSTGVKA